MVGVVGAVGPEVGECAIVALVYGFAVVGSCGCSVLRTATKLV